MEKKRKMSKNEIIEDVIFYVVLMPLVIITVAILLQTIIFPDRIPNVFGYKMFIVLDGRMEQSISYGDLVFTKNIETNNIKNGDIIAFRNSEQKVTIHKVIGIDDQNKVFTMQTTTNETMDTKYANEQDVEGLLINKISKIGLVILFLQEPFVFIFLVCIILIVGMIAYYFAQELDKKDMKQSQV